MVFYLLDYGLILFHMRASSHLRGSEPCTPNTVLSFFIITSCLLLGSYLCFNVGELNAEG